MEGDLIYKRCVKVLSSLDKVIGKQFSNRVEEQIYVPVYVDLPVGTIRVCTEVVSLKCDTSVSSLTESDHDDFSSSDVLTLPERPQQEEDFVLNVLQKLQAHKLDELVRARAVQCTPDICVDITSSKFTRPVPILGCFDVSGMERVKCLADNNSPVSEQVIRASTWWPVPSTSRQPRITSSSSKEKQHERKESQPSGPNHSEPGWTQDIEHAVDISCVSGYNKQPISEPCTSQKRWHTEHLARRQHNPKVNILSKKERSKKSSALHRLKKKTKKQDVSVDLRILMEKNTNLKTELLTLTTDIKHWKSLLLRLLFNKQFFS